MHSSLPTNIFGIDPGAAGAIAHFRISDRQIELVDVYDMPFTWKVVGKVVGKVVEKKKRRRVIDEDGLALIFKIHAPRHAFIEAVGARPAQGSVSTFSFGAAFGILKGVAASHHCQRSFIPPRQWKGAFGLSSNKNQSLIKARTAFPEAQELFTQKKHEGRAEAALIGLYGIRNSGVMA